MIKTNGHNRISSSRQSALAFVAVAILLFATIAWAEEVANRPDPTPIPGLSYVEHNLVSDIAGLAINLDSNLVNSWGIAHPPTGPWWVNDNGTGIATTYNRLGMQVTPPPPPIVTIPTPMGGTPPSTPSGIVFNDTTSFGIAPGEPARFIFVTEDGTISGWNPNVDMNNAILLVDNSPESVYKGVTIATIEAKTKLAAGSYLYVANLRVGTVDVFDTDFHQVVLPAGAFDDPRVPEKYVPFNVQNIGGSIVVTYALPDQLRHDNLNGNSKGYVSIFEPDGDLVSRLQHGSWMNAPWGVALAPGNFGVFSNDLLIGMFGSGRIAAFDRMSGRFQGFLKDPSGRMIQIDGLWGLAFGNGNVAGPTNALFFAAGINGESDGLFGYLAALGIAEK